jgi:hypothetical protein
MTRDWLSASILAVSALGLVLVVARFVFGW